MKKQLLSMLLMAIPLTAWCADGDTFTYTTKEGVRLTMMVVSEDEKTCQVGNDLEGAFITEDYEGPLTIPSTASGYTVVRLGKSALAGNSWSAATSVSLPETLSSIGEETLATWKIQTITIPASVTEIGSYAFYKCEKLATATLSNSLTVLEGGLFNNCKALTALTIPENVTDIYGNIIDSTSVGSIVVTKNVTTLERDAFIGAPLTSLSVDAENTTFDSRDNCNAVIRTGGWFHENEPEIWIGTRNTTFPSSVKYICNDAFQRVSGLKDIAIPEGYLGVGDGAFYECYDLETVTLPSTLKELGGNAFYQEQNKITTVTANMTSPMPIDKNTFNCYDTAKLVVPTGTEDTYKSVAGWSLFYGIATGINTVRTAITGTVSYYSIDGRQQLQLRHGLNVVRMTDGSVKKIMVK